MSLLACFNIGISIGRNIKVCISICYGIREIQIKLYRYWYQHNPSECISGVKSLSVQHNPTPSDSLMLYLNKNGPTGAVVRASPSYDVGR